MYTYNRVDRIVCITCWIIRNYANWSPHAKDTADNGRNAAEESPAILRDHDHGHVETNHSLADDIDMANITYPVGATDNFVAGKHCNNLEHMGLD